jgi:plasmid stability protein
MNIFISNVPDELHQALKIKAAKNKVSMKKIILAAIRKEVKVK